MSPGNSKDAIPNARSSKVSLCVMQAVSCGITFVFLAKLFG